jgi:anti-anti-sigma factor
MERTLTLTIDEQQLPIAVVRLRGFLAQLEVYKLKKQIDILIDLGRRCLIIDLSEVEFIDSAGIGAIVQIRTRCLQMNGQLMIIEPHCLRVADSLAATSLPQAVKCFTDLDAALIQMRKDIGLPDAGVQLVNTESQIRHLADTMDRILERLGRIETLLAEKLSSPR